jgi:hypothetical protein
MAGSDESAEVLLSTASAKAAAGHLSAARAGYVRAYDQARTRGDLSAMTQAALGLAAGQPFGTFPGRVPAFLHEAYSLAAGEQRAQLAVALARAWAYGGDPARAVGFAAEALAEAETRGDRALLAQALDAQLLVHWGPDDLDERLRITTRLEDTVAHLTDVEARMSAHLWRLTTALECLDLPSVRRQLRALDGLGVESESARVQFFAASRRGMYALLTGDLSQAEQAKAEAVATGTQAGEADTNAIERTLSAGIARQAGDRASLAREAAAYEAFGVGEAVTSIAAEAAVLWVAAGHADRARSLLHQLAGRDLSGITRDVDWLLTVTSLTEVAAATGAKSLAEQSIPLLKPYAGRGVVNAGGVAFTGVVDDYLRLASRALGRDHDAQGWAAGAANAYERMGATWWLHRDRHVPQRRGVVHLRPGEDGIWWVGHDGALSAVRDIKGLHCLRMLLERPGTDIPALDLSDAVAGHPGAGLADADTGELLDRQALASYRQRLTEIDDDLDEARSWDDIERGAKLEAERDALIEQLRAATGLAGRQRRTGATSERARIAVRKAVATAIERIAAVDASLGRLVRDTVSTGSTCRYDPDPDRPI